MSDIPGTVRRVLVEELRANQTSAVDKLEREADDLALGHGGLGISSLLLLHILVKLENSLGFTFEDAAVAGAKFVTVGDLVSFVDRAVRGHDAAGLEGE